MSITAIAWGQAPATARELNNQGVRQFARGEYRDAEGLLVRALQAWRDETPLQERNDWRPRISGWGGRNGPNRWRGGPCG